MANWYEKFRSEMVAGGAVDENSSASKKDGAWVGLVVIALLAWLGFKNPWALLFVFGLLVSVFLHEVGHFVTARRTGMKVTQFFMGFGPRIWSVNRGETEYGVRAFPLGAFVRIVGMNNLDEVASEDETRSYRSKSFPRRILVITAGTLMHMVIAAALIIGVYSTSGRLQETGSVQLLAAPEHGSPAHLVGLREGDIIESVDGIEVNTRTDLVVAIVNHKPGDSIDLIVQRGGDLLNLSPVLIESPVNPEAGYLGVSTSSRDYVALNPAKALWWGGGDIVDMMSSSVHGVVTALNPVNSVKHLTNSDSATDNSRPTTVVGASQLGGDIGRDEGLKGVLLLLAAVNVFVGVFNMFPLLPFDGGHAVIAIYERIRSRSGKRYFADVSKMIPLTTAVVVMMALLLITGLYLDISKPLG